MSDYDEIKLPEGCADLDWDIVPAGYINWVHYWVEQYQIERKGKRQYRSEVELSDRLIGASQMDIPKGSLLRRVTAMLQRIKNQHAIISEQRTYIRRLEDTLGHNKKVS